MQEMPELAGLLISSFVQGPFRGNSKNLHNLISTLEFEIFRSILASLITLVLKIL